MDSPEVTVKEVIYHRVECSHPRCGFVYQGTDKALSIRVAKGHDKFHRFFESKQTAEVDAPDKR